MLEKSLPLKVDSVLLFQLTDIQQELYTTYLVVSVQGVNAALCARFSNQAGRVDIVLLFLLTCIQQELNTACLSVSCLWHLCRGLCSLISRATSKVGKGSAVLHFVIEFPAGLCILPLTVRVPASGHLRHVFCAVHHRAQEGWLCDSRWVVARPGWGRLDGSSAV